MTWREMVGWGVRHWMAGLVGLLFGALGGLSILYYSSTQPPVIVDDVETSDDLILQNGHQPGDHTISFFVKIDRARSCPVEVSRFLWRWVERGGERIRDFHGIENPPLTPVPDRGVQKYELTLHVPDDLPAGQWFERTVTLTRCPVFGSLFAEPPHQSPDRPITVLDGAP